MNAPLRLKFSVVPSTKPAGVLIETGHLTLALVWWRLSVSITAYEIVASGASDNGNLNCSQNTTTRWGVSNERQDGGVEKREPPSTRPNMPMGEQ